MKFKFLNIIFFLSLLSACSKQTTLTSDQYDHQSAQGAPAQKPVFSEYKGVPVPGNAALDLKRSLILGSGDNWTGQIVITSEYVAPLLIEFYQSEMPKMGWNELTTRRSKTTSMTFERTPRMAEVEISPTGSNKCEIKITISPRSSYGS